jgi:hypothetical protein
MECYFSAVGMTDMYFMHAHANGTSREAGRLYAKHYPQRRIAAYKLFTKFKE